MPTGMITTSDLTVGVKIDMDEAIYLISPVDSPFINGLDSQGNLVLGSAPTDEIEFFDLDEELLLPRSTTSGAVTTGDTYIQLASSDERLKFSTGDVLAFKGSSELVRVTGYNATAGRLDVTRAFAGTTAGSIASGLQVISLGTALAEGSDPEAARSRDRAQASNYTQIFGPTAIHLSGTEQVVAKYGVADEFSHQVLNRTKENVIMREQAYLYGVKYNSTTSKIRTTGGLFSQITSNVDSTSTQLTVTSIQAQMQACYEDGGVPDLLMTNPACLSDLNALNDADRVRVDIDDPRRGRQRVMVVHTEFGDVTVVRNRYVFKNHAALWTKDQLKRRILRGFQMERLAKTGDSDKAQILCEEGLQLKGEEHAAKFTALAYT